MAQRDLTSIDWTPVVKAQVECQQKVIQKTAKAILKKTDLADVTPKRKFSFTSVKDTDELYTLAAYLFVFEKFDLCYEVCSIYDYVEFNGDHTLWSYISSLRCMQIAILNMRGDREKSAAILQVLSEHELPEENRARVWKTTNKRILDRMADYKEQKNSSLRYAIMGAAMIYMEFIIMEYLPEQNEKMKEQIENIFEFLRAEEK